MTARVVVMELLSADFRQTCADWYAGLPIAKRTAVDAWLVDHPMPAGAPDVDRVAYAFCTVPITIDLWVVCRVDAADATPAWRAERGPLVDVQDNGDCRAWFRESELVEVPS